MLVNLFGIEIDLAFLLGSNNRPTAVPHVYWLAGVQEEGDFSAGSLVIGKDGGVQVDLRSQSVAVVVTGVLVTLIIGSISAINSASLFGVICCVAAAICVSTLPFDTSWLIGDHWMLHRRSIHGRYACEALYRVHRLEIENGVWTSGRGSSDELFLQGPDGRVQIRGVNADNNERVVPIPDEPPISREIVQLGRLLAYHCQVPLRVTVTEVPEPSAD